MLHPTEKRAIELEPELLAPVRHQRRYTTSVPVKLPTTRPTEPQWNTATNTTIAATVISTLATLAIAYCTDRSSTRKSDVSCL